MNGFSLVEVLVSMALMASTAVGVTELFVVSTRASQASRSDMAETMAAVSKMAELRASTFTFDAAGVPVTDAALAVNSAGYVDFIDAKGAPAAGPAVGVYVRRWSIQPLPSDPANAVVLQVTATRATRPNARGARLVSILARSSPKVS